MIQNERTLERPLQCIHVSLKLQIEAFKKDLDAGNAVPDISTQHIKAITRALA